MPYIREGKCVYKENPDKSKGTLKGCSDSVAGAKKYMAALYAHENTNKALSEFSMHIDKASRDKKTGAMRLRLVNSDTGSDVFDEKMSLELFQDFVRRSDAGDPIPAPFDEVISEAERGWWNGGPPYLSIAHYKSGAGRNVPGKQEKLYIDGEKLKSVDELYDTPLGNAVWEAVYDDLYSEEKSYENPVRVSIGFLDLEHKHEAANEDGSDYVFTRTELGQRCEMCDAGVKNKVYLKGHLVHKAFTRVPANERTLVEVDEMAEKSGIISKKDDARSIVDDLAEELEEKSAVDEMLVMRGEVDYREYANKVDNAFSKQFAPPPRPYLYVAKVTDKYVLVSESSYDDSTDMYDHKIYKVGYKENDGKFTFDKRSDWAEMEYGLMPKKSEATDNEWEIDLMDEIQIEEAISKREDVSVSDKKRAEKKYGNVTYADSKNKKYPVDTEEHIRAAWNYIGQKKNQAKYSAAEVAAIKKRIIAAWKSKIDKAGPPAAQKSKSEAIMDENEVLENEPVVEDEQEEQEEVVDENTQKPVVEESVVEKAVKGLTAKIEELKTKGVYGADALKEVQPLFNQVGEVVKTELSVPAGHVDEEAIAERVAAKLMPALAEMIGKSISAQAPVAPENNGTVVRSISLQTPSLPVDGQEKKSQIQAIAERSTGLS